LTAGGYPISIVCRNSSWIPRGADYVSFTDTLWSDDFPATYTPLSTSWWYFAIAWESEDLPAFSSAEMSLLVIPSRFPFPPPTLDLSATVFPDLIDRSMPVNIRGRIVDLGSVSSLSLLVAVDDDFENRINLSSTLTNQSDFDIPFRVNSSKVATAGMHKFCFYAVSLTSGVSNPTVFSASVLVPTKTPIPTRTRTLTPPASPTASRSPFASPTARPTGTVAQTAPPSASAQPLALYFEKQGTTSFQLFATVNGTLQSLGNSYAIVVNSQHPTSLAMSATGQNTPRLAVTLTFTNPNDFLDNLRVGINTDVNFFNQADNAPMHSLGIRTGMGMTNGVHNLTFLLANRPNVTPVTTYWFGPYSNRGNYQWEQVSYAAMVGEDSALAFSWQDLILPAAGSLALTFEMHSLGVSAPPLLAITTGIPSEIQLPSSTRLRGTVATFRADTEICIVCVVDSDLTSGRSIWGTSISSNLTFEFEIPQGALHVGSHLYSLYAVDSTGAVSQGQHTVCIATGLTATRSRSAPPLPTPHPSRTRTMSDTPSSTPLPTPTPFPPVAPFSPAPFPLDAYPVGNGYNFNIVGQESGGNVSTTQGNLGYKTAGWIGSAGFQIVGCQTVSNTDGSIATRIATDPGNVSLHFDFANLRQTSTDFALVIAGNLSLGDGFLPNVDVWQHSTDFRVRSADRQIVWDAFGDATSGWIGEPYAGLGTVNDRGYMYGSTESWATMLKVHAGRLYFSFSLAGAASATITVRVGGSVVRRPPFLAITNFHAWLETSAADAGVRYEVLGLPNQAFKFTVFGILGHAQYRFVGQSDTLSAAGTSSYVGISSHYSWQAFPPGHYSISLHIEDPDGGAVLLYNLLSADVADVTAVSGATPQRSASPARSRTRAASVPETPRQTPRETVRMTVAQSPQIYFTASFAVRSSRVRKIFRFSYLIPIILNR
jgi:hypothetical protein